LGLNFRMLQQLKPAPAWHIGLSGAPRWLGGKLGALENRRGDVAINHRTVRWCTGLSGESSAPAPKSSAMNSSLSGKAEGNTAKIHRTVRWCIGLSGEPTALAANGRLHDQRATCGLANGQMIAPDSVRCANRSEDPTVGFARKGKRSRTGLLQ
jgi:hypothetical protein